MGEVYLARDTRLDRPVALKLLPSSLTSDPDRVRRFEREARAASSLSHPNIITVHEIGEEDGLRFIVTEYVEGRTLRELIESGGLNLPQALDTAIQVASALQAAHRVGVVHRDVKPENVMVREDGYVKVLDFGLAKLAERAAPAGEPGEMAATLLKQSTQTGLVMGTTRYMSPEQARGQKVDARTDVWSLGVVLYEMVTARSPFDGETPSDVLVSVLTKEPQPLSQYAPEAPAELQQIVSKALVKEREGRYQTMQEMLDELREAREEVTFRARQELHSTGGGGSSLPASVAAAQGRAGRRWGRATLWAAALVAAVSALAFGMYQYVKSRRAPRTPPTVKMTGITADGKISQAAVSPDGKYIAYAAGPQGQQ
jgi:serine/threonine protein kinase